MFAMCRFASRRISLRPAWFIKPDFLTSVRAVTIKGYPYKPRVPESHDDRNMRIGRPLSPHLTIYEAALTSMMSITHRLTGAAFGGFLIVFSVASLILPGDFCDYLEMLADLDLGPVPIYLGRFILAFPICYHLCNGIRHLIWDLGFFLTIKLVYLTGYCAITSALALTAYVIIVL